MYRLTKTELLKIGRLAPCLRSIFPQQHSDGRVRNHGSILPCINSSGWWWLCNDVDYIFLAPNECHLNTTAYMSIFCKMKMSKMWPPQSPRLSPLEHLQDAVKQEIGITDVQHLCDAFMSIWTQISEECFQLLVNLWYEDLRML